MALHDIHFARRISLRLRVGVTTWAAVLPLDFYKSAQIYGAKNKNTDKETSSTL